MECQTEAVRSVKLVSATSYNMDEIHGRQRILNNFISERDEQVEKILCQLVEIGSQMQNHFEERRLTRQKMLKGAPTCESRDKILSQLVQLKKEKKALEDMLGDKKQRMIAAQSLGEKLTAELDSAHRLNAELESVRKRVEPQVLRLRKEAEEKELLAERTVSENARRHRTFQEREVLVQAKLTRQETDTSVRVGKIEALQLRLEYIEQKAGGARERLLIFAEAKALNQQLKHQIAKAINDFELRHAALKAKLKEEEIAKREAERDVLELQQAIHVVEEEREEVEACPASSVQNVAELQKQIEQSNARVANYEAQVKAINAKIKEFTHLMDKLIEENQMLKRIVDERREGQTRAAFQEISNRKTRDRLSHFKDDDK